MDTATLHLQFWCLAVGFVVALVGLLWTRAPRWLVWPAAVLAVAAPRMTESLLAPQADFILDFFVAIGALLLLLWVLEDRAAWLWLATPLLVAAVLTKREGLMLVVCLLVATVVAREAALRRSWRPLAVVVALVGAATIAWHAWYASKGIGGEVAPGGGFSRGLDLGRAGDSLWLSVRVLMDWSRWSAIPWISFAAIAVAALRGRWRIVGFASTAVGLAILGGAWVTWSFRELSITSQESLNPIVRYTGAIQLLLVALAPLLLAGAVRELLPRPGILVTPLAGLGAVAAVLLLYPVATLASGTPRFPSRSDCAKPPVAGQPVAVVYGRFDRLDRAQALIAKLAAVGFESVVAESDGCGRVVVRLPNAPSVDVGQSIVDEARGSKFEAHLELGHS